MGNLLMCVMRSAHVDKQQRSVWSCVCDAIALLTLALSLFLVGCVATAAVAFAGVVAVVAVRCTLVPAVI